MYPLIEPSLEEINAQLEQISSIDDLKLNAENKYTGLILQQAIKNALSKAKSQSVFEKCFLQDVRRNLRYIFYYIKY